MISETEIWDIHQKLLPIFGQVTWGIELGVGSFITMNWGIPLLPDKHGAVYGEWYLWIYNCSWRIEQSGAMVAGSSDSSQTIEETIQNLEECKVLSIEVLPAFGDTIISFEGDKILRMFNSSSEESPAWMLFTPDQYVITLGPGTSWSYEAADESN